MKTASWVLLAVAGALTMLGSLASVGIAYGTDRDQIGPASLSELAAGRPEVATAVRARRATAAAYGVGFATLFLLITLGPYRRGTCGRWAVRAGIRVVTVSTCCAGRSVVYDQLASAVTAGGDGTVVLVQLLMAGRGSVSVRTRLRQEHPRRPPERAVRCVSDGRFVRSNHGAAQQGDEADEA